MNDARADFIIKNTLDQPTVIVEVKAREGLNQDYATAYRDSLLAHGVLPRLPYFLLVSQDNGYLWDQQHNSDAQSRASLAFSMKPIIRRYWSALDAERLYAPALEMLVLGWLMELCNDPDTTREPEKSLAQLDFIAAIKGGSVVTEAWV